MNFLVLALVLVPGEGPSEMGVPAYSAQASLEDTAGRFAGLWSSADIGRIGDLLVPDGIRLHLGEVGHHDLAPRQALAALRDFLRAHRSNGARMDRVSEVGGQPPRGFAEITWEAVAQGTTEMLRYTVYVGFILEDESWHISELRVFR